MRKRCDPSCYTLSILATMCLFVWAAPVVTSVATAADSKRTDPLVDLPENHTITVQEPTPWAGWDEGSFVVNFQNPRNETKAVTITFRGVRQKSLTSLVVSTPDWRVDVTNHVKNLVSPFPNRIGLVFSWDSAGRFDEMLLNLPFLLSEDRSLGTEARCRSWEIDIKAGRVTSSGVSNSPARRCDQ
jgi:hypothetical protein